MPAALIVATVTGALTAPLATAAAVVGTAVAALSIRWPVTTATGFMVTGPLFLSGFVVGPLTLDNVTVAYGAFVGTAWLLTRRLRVTPLAAWPTGLAVAVVLAAAANGGAGLAGAARFLSLTVLVLVLAASGSATLRRSVTAIEVAVTLGALVILAQPLTGYPDPYGTAEGMGQRFGGLFGHPNFAAYTLCLVLLFQMYTRQFTPARMASASVLLLALLLTGSRAALLVLLVLLIPALWMRFQRFIGLLVPALAALPFVGTTILTRLESLAATGGLAGRNASGWRLDQWRDAIALTDGHEAFGIGWGRTASAIGDDLGAHSTYVQLWLELGRVGTAVVAVGGILLIRATRSVRPAQVLLGYALVTSVGDPVLVYPSCLTVLLVLLSGLLPARGGPAHDPSPEAAGPTDRGRIDAGVPARGPVLEPRS